MNAFIESSINTGSTLVDDHVLDEFIHFMGEEGDGLAKELIELYLKNAPIMIAEVEADILSGNSEALKAHVHGLKGSSAQLGVNGIAEVCRSIENAILEGETEHIRPLFEQLKANYQHVADYFQYRLEIQR